MYIPVYIFFDPDTWPNILGFHRIFFGFFSYKWGPIAGDKAREMYKSLDSSPNKRNIV